MVKKLQALKAKKGFTLVELVVVIAIIGVLAAILIPTMIGVVQDSRISSADTAASQIRTQVTTFFTKADTAGHTFQGPASAAKYDITVTNGAWAWTTAPDAAVKFMGATTTQWIWGTGAETDKETVFLTFMKSNLSDISNAAISIYVDNEKCVGVSYIEGGTASEAGTMPDVVNFTSGNNICTKFTTKAGVVGNVVVGTNPKLTKTTA